MDERHFVITKLEHDTDKIFYIKSIDIQRQPKICLTENRTQDSRTDMNS